MNYPFKLQEQGLSELRIMILLHFSARKGSFFNFFPSNAKVIVWIMEVIVSIWTAGRPACGISLLVLKEGFRILRRHNGMVTHLGIGVISFSL